jgi:hypothetical protein
MSVDTYLAIERETWDYIQTLSFITRASRLPAT